MDNSRLYVDETTAPVLDPARGKTETGYPKTIRVDQGSEFASRDLDLWAYANGVTLDFSRPRKPTDNSFIEAFKSKFPSECLNAHWFMSLEDARAKLEDWRRYYNEERPHSGIGQNTPIQLHNFGGASSPSLAKVALPPGNWTILNWSFPL